MEVHIVQEVVIKTIPKKNKCKKAKWQSEEALQIAEKRREVKGNETLPSKAPGGKNKPVPLSPMAPSAPAPCTGRPLEAPGHGVNKLFQTCGMFG